MLVRKPASLVSTFAFWLWCASISVVLAQAPTGNIAGVVTDPSGAPFDGAQVTVINRETRLTRNVITSEEGDYSAAAIPPGGYKVTAEAKGFTPLERIATVEAGTTTRIDL